MRRLPDRAPRIAARAPLQPQRRPAWLGAAAFWIHRYLAQDLIAKLATATWAWTMLSDEAGAGVGAGSCALVEIAAFYAVVWLRARRAEPASPTARRSLCAAIVREYGPAELVDFAVRPAAMGFVFTTGTDAVAAALLGSLLADGAFYCTAMLACRRSGITARARAS